MENMLVSTMPLGKLDLYVFMLVYQQSNDLNMTAF